MIIYNLFKICQVHSSYENANYGSMTLTFELFMDSKIKVLPQAMLNDDAKLDENLSAPGLSSINKFEEKKRMDRQTDRRTDRHTTIVIIINIKSKFLSCNIQGLCH